MAVLTGKVALVTGASSGIGRATALLYAKEGAKLVVGARRGVELEALVTQIAAQGGEAVALAGDVTEERYAQALVACAMEKYGRLDIAFNNAGSLGEMLATPDLSFSAWRAVLAANLDSAFLGAKYQLPAMVKNSGGSLIFTASFVGCTLGMPQMAAYAASKAGVVGLVKALAVEYGASNIRVNALLPGGTDTPMAAAFGDSPEVQAFVRNMHALKRIAQPEEIAQSALYLASDASSFSTGTALLVDGGVSISKT